MTVLRSGAASDVGRVRNSNQDLYLDSVNLFAVADGMGGHAGGEVAARMAIDTIRQQFALHPTVPGLRQAVAEANAAVWRESQVHTDLRGMGTTLTAAALVGSADGGDVIAVANVGDSRAYVFSERQLTQVTDDHSLAEEKVRLGELSEAEAAVHPHRHILTRALGIGTDVQVDLWELHLRAGDRFLLCSDGLSNEVDPVGIANVLASIPDPQAAADELVRLANEHGGHDNVTVVVVDVLVGEESAPGAGATGVVPMAGPGGATGPGTDAPPPWSGSGRPPTTGGGPGRAVDDTIFIGGGGRGDGLDDTTVVSPQPSAPPPPTPQRPPASLPPLMADAGYAAQGGATGGGRPRSWRQRRLERRLAGIPRRLTLRVLIFVVLVVGVVYVGYAFIRFYATDNYFVTINGTHLAIYQGRPGGLLWYKPKLVEMTPVTVTDVLPQRVGALRGDVDEPTLRDAKRYVATLYAEYLTGDSVLKDESVHPAPSSTVVSPFATATTSTSSTTSTTAAVTTPSNPKETTVPSTPKTTTTTSTTTTLPPTTTSTTTTLPPTTSTTT